MKRNRPYLSHQRPRLIAVLVLLFLSVGCGPTRPTAEECLRGLKNFVSLRFPSTPGKENPFLKMAEGKTSQALAQKCVQERSRTEILCQINAKTLEEIKGCIPKKKKSSKKP